MKRFLFVCAGFFVASVSAPAQAPDSRWNAYAFLAPGTSTSVESGRATLHVGGGAEAFLYQGLSLGAEIGTCLFMDNAHTGVEVGTRPLSATSIAMAASKWMWVAANDLARSTHASLHSRLGRILAIVRSAVFIPLPTACSD